LIDDMFVVDAGVHVLDFSHRPPPYQCGPAATSPYASVPYEWRSRRAALAAMYDLEFVQSPVDMAMVRPLPVSGWPGDGLAPLDTQAAFAAAHPDQVLLCGAVDPARLGVHGARAEMRRQVEELGARSVAFSNAYGEDSWHCDDKELAYPLYEEAQRLGIDVLQFSKGMSAGGRPAEDVRPHDLQRPARDFPDLQLVIHHLSVPALFEETVSIAARFPNVWLTLGGLLSAARITPRAARTQIGELLSHVGPERLLWSSGAALNGSPATSLETFLTLDIADDLRADYGLTPITENDRRGILGENFTRLFGIDVEARRRELGLTAASASRGPGATGPSANMALT
jgi:predicted TIM-barrel fold metal-dependent hydrolase